MVARTYSLETGETKSIVCKKFFRATLDIGEAYINHALKGKSEGHFQGLDNRGRHTPANKIPEYKLKKVREHIESFQSLMHITPGKTQTGDSLDMTSTLLKCTSCTKMKDKRKAMKK